MRMSAVIVALALAMSTAQAQTEPAKEMARFDALLGNWEGSGTSVKGTEGGKWTSRSTVAKILGGQVVQEDTRVDLEGMPAPLAFRAVYSWDARTGKYRFLSLGNTGEVEHGNIYWTEDGGLVGANMTMHEGQPVARRWVYKFTGKDTYDFRIEGARGTGDFVRSVTGTFKRGGAGFSALEAVAAVVPPSSEMKKLESQLGQWTLKGAVSMAPGQEPMSFTGTESTRAILGGHVHYTEQKGDQVEGMPTWEGRFYSAWDAADRSFQSLWIDNMGNWSPERMHALGDNRFVSVGAGVQDGTPQTNRNVIEVTKDSARIVAHRCFGDQAPDKSFEGTWTRIAAKEGEKPAGDRGK